MMKKLCLITVIVLAIALLFGAVGCDKLKMDDDSEVGLTIDGAYNFTASAKLNEKVTYASASEIASMIERISDGMVTASALSDKVIAEGSASYKLELTEIPTDVSLREYLDRVESDYLASFEGWSAFPDAPVVYTTKDGKDVLVILDHDGKTAEVTVYVLYFTAGSVSELVSSLAGDEGQQGNGGNTIDKNGSYVDGSGQQGNGTNGGKDKSDDDPIGGNGDIGGDGDGDGDGAYGGEDEGGEGTPTFVRYSIIDIDQEGNEVPYLSDTVAYGSEVKFDWCEYMVFYDKEFKQEIDPNTGIKMEGDLVVYRRDYYNRVPVFVTIHYYINGMEYTNISGQRTFFRGQLWSTADKEYIYYRDVGKSEALFADDAPLVIREEDDTGHFYAFKEDPLFHKVTFKIGGSDIGTLLMYEGEMISMYSAMALGGSTQYYIRDCTDYETPVTRDLVVTITDYDVYHYFPITVHVCYEGKVKYTFVNYWLVGYEYNEVSEGMNYFNDVNCTERFTGAVDSARTFYTPAAVVL